MLEKSAHKVNCLVPKLADLLQYLQADHRLVTPGHVRLYSNAIDDLTQEAQNLNEVIKMLSVSSGKPHPATNQLNIWLKEWWAVRSSLAEVSDFQSPDIAENVGFAPLENYLTQILLTVERLYKRHCSAKAKKEEAEKEEDVKDLLSIGLVKQLQIDTKDLQLKESVTNLQDLVKLAELQPNMLQKLKASLPLLEQYHAICESLLNVMAVSNRCVAKFTSVLIAVFQNLAVRGFCRPQELQDEENGEEGTNFEDAEGTGLGEGEGKKDVSDRIESEDQLESALKEGENEQAGDKDLQEEDQGIEMNEDFEGKMQDIEKNGEESESDDDDKDKENLDKQMGETEKGADKLDEKLWGEEEGDEEEEDTKDQDDEDGPGGEASESKMVAKDDNKSKKEKDKDQKKKEKLEEMEDTRRENEMDEDGEEYDDNFTDPYGGEANMEDEEEEKMELPDDMTLDNGEQNEKEDDMEQPPMEIEEKGVFPEEEKEPKDNGQEDENEDHHTEKQNSQDDEGKAELGEDSNREQDEDESSEGTKKDERKQGTEEVNNLDNDEESSSADKADASADKDSKTPAEAAEMDTTEGSKDQTKVSSCCS